MTFLQRRLLASTILVGIVPLPAYAQSVVAVAAPAPAAAAPEDEMITVTGSLFRRTDTETPSPVTVLSIDDIEKRGLQTVQAAIQSISSNNGPALTNSFTANGAFAAGASSISLRGLTTNSTLVLFDGLRASYYPLADDGTRNFVDLNTIPDEIVERVEVLRTVPRRHTGPTRSPALSTSSPNTRLSVSTPLPRPESAGAAMPPTTASAPPMASATSPTRASTSTSAGIMSTARHCTSATAATRTIPPTRPASATKARAAPTIS